MNFHELMAKMRDLDQPSVTPSVTEEPLSDCGDMGAPMGAPNAAMPKDHPPPSMSVNLNAQGMDDIESLMKLLTKVNPDMMPKGPAADMPTIDISPMKPSMPPMSLGNLDAGPLKMLPDLDKDEPEGVHAEPDADNMGGPSDNDTDNMPGGMDGVSKAQGDLDNDGDHDMDDHDMEKDDKKKDEWANEPDEDVKDVDYMVNKLAGGMNRPKGTYPKVAGGDNPMQRMEGTDLRASIKAELQRRLAEAKGAK